MADDNQDAKDNPGVITHPPFLYLGMLVFGGVIDWIKPASFTDSATSASALQIVGWVILAIGIGFMAAAITRFKKAGTNVQTSKPAEALVTVGIYQFTRNPIYVGMSLIYAGLSFLFDNPWSLVLLVPVLLIIRFGVIGREEKYLEAKFGEAYVAYKRKVRRWL